MAANKDYNAFFDPALYLHTYYDDFTKDESLVRFVYEAFHRIFMKGDLHGKRLLDIGTGPSICSVISPASYFEEIYLCDYTDANRVFLQKWMDGEADYSFQPIIEYILKLEDRGTSWSKRENGIRRKIKGILKCDLSKSKILTDGQVGQADVITSTFCIEVVAADLPRYKEICKKIAAMVKDGGHVVLAGVLEQTCYCLGGNKISTLYSTKDDIIQSWENEGFSITDWQEEKAPPAEANLLTDHKAIFVSVARKGK